MDDTSIVAIYNFFKQPLVNWILTIFLMSVALQQMESFGSSVGKAIFRFIN
jgi:hypothetical protein